MSTTVHPNDFLHMELPNLGMYLDMMKVNFLTERNPKERTKWKKVYEKGAAIFNTRSGKMLYSKSLKYEPSLRNFYLQ